MSASVGSPPQLGVTPHGVRNDTITPNRLENGGINPPRPNGLIAGLQASVAPYANAALATAGAVTAQLAQQVITCGVPTFAREEVVMQLFSALREKHPALAVGLQAGMSLATILAHTHIREGRMNRATEQNVGVAGHMGVSRDEFARLPVDVQAQKNAEHQAHSKSVTRSQIAAEALFGTMAVVGLATGNHDLTARLFATQMRNLVYAATRETGQATLGFTRSSDTTHGVNEANMTKMAVVYAGMTLAMGVAQDFLARRLLPEGQHVSGGSVSGADGKILTGSDLQKAIALVATARAICNTAVELVDASLGRHFENSQVGGQQSAQEFSKLVPHKDYQRLLDHSPTRLAWNNSANAASLIFQQVTAANGHPAAGVTSVLNNSVSAAAFGLMYPMINQTYQAHAKIRAEIASPTAPPEMELAVIGDGAPAGDDDERASTVTPDGAVAARTSGSFIEDITDEGVPDTNSLSDEATREAPAVQNDARVASSNASTAPTEHSLEAAPVLDPANIPLPPIGADEVPLPPPGPDEIPLPESPISAAASLAEEQNLPARS